MLYGLILGLLLGFTLAFPVVYHGGASSAYCCFDQDLNTTDDVQFHNITTDNATFEYVDKLERTEPGTPPTNTLRLYVESIKGFSFYKFLDDTGMKRALVRDSLILVKNIRGTTIAANCIVYANGSEDDIPTVDTAKADSLDTMPAIGVTIESIANNSYGRVMQVGLLENINTIAYPAGTVLYVSDITAGVPKATAPVTPNLVQEIGTVLASHATLGSIQVVARALDGNEFGTINNFTIQQNLYVPNMKTGTDQADAGAIAGELWADSNDDFTVKLGQ